MTEIVNSRLVDALKPFFLTWSAYLAGTPPAAGVNSITANDGINADVPTGDVTLNVDLATPSGLSFATGQLQIDDSVAGQGLFISSKVLGVAVTNSLAIVGDAVGLNTPGTLSSSSSNDATSGNHTHAIDSTIARSAITLTAGLGLLGGGDLTISRTFDVGAGAGIAVTADSVAVSLAGTSGLTLAGDVLAISDTIAGLGLSITGKVLNIGSGDGIFVDTDVVALNLPGTLSVSSTSSAAGNHTHAITSSNSITTATATLMATDANGHHRLRGLGVGAAAADNSVVLPNGGFVGLTGSGARLWFVDAATDLIRVVGGRLHMHDGASDKLQLANDGTITTVSGSWIGLGSSTARVEFNSSSLVRILDAAFAVGDGTGAKSIEINGAAGSVRDLKFQSGGLGRWILRATPTAESGGNAGTDLELSSRTDAGGTLVTAISVQRSNGAVQIGSPTGGFKGTGTLNAVGLYDDNVLVSDHIFDLYYAGRMSAEDAARFPDARLWSIEETAIFTRQYGHLPTMPGRDEWAKGSRSLGAMVTALWETVEQQQLQIFDLQEQVNGNA